MPCLQPDGTLSRIGILILQAARQPATMEAISKDSGLPLFRARSAVRGLVKASMVTASGKGYVATGLGIKKLEDST